MKRPAACPRRCRHIRRGGVLFEAMLAVALFAGAAAFTLAAVRSVLDSLERVRLQQEAVDLAKSRLAQLEAGLISLADIRDGLAAETAAPSDVEPESNSQTSGASQWTFDLKTSRTEFTDLTLVELTVLQELSEGDDSTPMSCTLRQLIALRPTQADAYEKDELTEGLEGTNE